MSCRDLEDEWGGTNTDTQKTFTDLNNAIAKSSYYIKSKSVQNETGDEYWLRPQELLSRAFEVYIDGKMRELGEYDEHLVSMYPHNPYPDFNNDKDAPIRQAFDAFFNVLEMQKLRYDIESLFGTNGTSVNEK
jgi:hypothetical protein